MNFDVASIMTSLISSPPYSRKNPDKPKRRQQLFGKTHMVDRSTNTTLLDIILLHLLQPLHLILEPILAFTLERQCCLILDAFRQRFRQRN